MNTRTLGFIAMLGSPFLAIDMFSNGIFERYQPSTMSSIFSLVYMTGWVCSIVALYKMKATGTRRLGRSVLVVQLLFLTLGEIWNIYSIIKPFETSMLFRILDLFWPISNCFMFFTGLTVLMAKRLSGWRRYIPFVVGLWFPTCLVLTRLLFGSSEATLYITALYSATAWLLLGLAAYTSRDEKIKIDFEKVIPELRATA